MFFNLEGKFKEALEEYEAAIKADPSVAVYYSNAATCHSRLGSNEKTLELINEAINLDPTFIKALYRRGVALMELKRYKEASEDFIKVCQEFPADIEAQKKLKSCDKELDKKLSFEESMRMGFSAAIRVEKFELTRKCIEGMSVDVGYDGPSVSFDNPLTVEWIRDTLIPYFKSDKKLHIKYAYSILLLAKESFEQEASLVDIPLEADETITVCGDVHGQFFDMIKIFETAGYPTSKHKILFNGDVVDRGNYSLECLLTLCALKSAFPSSIFVSRGNHESEPINRVHGFYDECTRKYKKHQFFFLSNQVLNTLPICYVINKKIFVVHGGLPAKPDIQLDEIKQIDRFRVPENGSIFSQLLWSDPQESNGMSPSPRGEGILFGPDITNTFLTQNSLNQIIRSHVWKEEGYSIEQSGKCITIFSAPNYTGSPSPGAFINISGREGVNFEYIKFKAAEYQGKFEKPRPSAPIHGGWY